MPSAGSTGSDGVLTTGSLSISAADGVLETDKLDYNALKHHEVEVHIEMVGPVWNPADIGKIITFYMKSPIDNAQHREVDYFQYLIGTSPFNVVLRSYVRKGPAPALVPVSFKISTQVSMGALVGGPYDLSYEIIEGGW